MNKYINKEAGKNAISSYKRAFNIYKKAEEEDNKNYNKKYTNSQKIIQISKKCGRKEPVFLMPIIESARGILHAFEIASASKNNVAIAIGLEDYTADIGIERTNEGKEFLKE